MQRLRIRSESPNVQKGSFTCLKYDQSTKEGISHMQHLIYGNTNNIKDVLITVQDLIPQDNIHKPQNTHTAESHN